MDRQVERGAKRASPVETLKTLRISHFCNIHLDSFGYLSDEGATIHSLSLWQSLSIHAFGLCRP